MISSSLKLFLDVIAASFARLFTTDGHELLCFIEVEIAKQRLYHTLLCYPKRENRVTQWFVVTLLRDICGQNGFKQNAKQSQQNDTLRTQSGVHKYVNEIKKNMANHRFYIQRHTYWYLNGKWSNVRTIEHTSRPHFEQQQQQQQQR